MNSNSWFLLPCSCGETVRVLPRHAGESRTCGACGKTLAVPSMREIRRLESVEDETALATTPTQTNWSAGRRALFVIGIPIFLIGAGMAAYCYSVTTRYKPAYVTKPTLEDARKGIPLELMQLDINALTPTETIEKVWTPLTKEEELPAYREHPYLGYRRARDGYRRRLKWASAAAGVGLLLTVIPLLLPGKK